MVGGREVTAANGREFELLLTSWMENMVKHLQLVYLLQGGESLFTQTKKSASRLTSDFR